MEFDKSKVYTALNADELKKGSRCIFANNLDSLRCKVVEGIDIRPVVQILNDSYERRFQTDVKGEYPFAYLVSEPEEKKLKWTDLKIGDIIKHKMDQMRVMVVGTNAELGHNELHILVANEGWLTDDELEDWEKVE